MLILLTIGVFLLVGGTVFARQKLSESEHVHIHAGFTVFVDGVKQDYTDMQYMHIAPCTTDAAEHKGDDQREKAHLHDGVGDVVHVHRDNAEWGDLFKNINVSFPKGKPITAYVNGYNVPDILTARINSYDRAIIVVGRTMDIRPDMYVTREHIQQTEQKSELCG